MVKTGFMHMIYLIISINNRLNNYYASLVINMDKFRNIQVKVTKILFKKIKTKLFM
jgi:hypothetical protein